eukprot:5738404-Lingulodinium_polyedra.AAC.1
MYTSWVSPRAADGSQGGYYCVELNYDSSIGQVAEFAVAVSKGEMVNSSRARIKAPMALQTRRGSTTAHAI